MRGEIDLLMQARGQMTNRAMVDLALLALKFAEAADNVAHCKLVLDAGYSAWREEAGFYDFMAKDSPEWGEMMAATAVEYRALKAAKDRERRAKGKLMKAANDVQARVCKALEGGK